jgi:large-conductance mechanosensitive channel
MVLAQAGFWTRHCLLSLDSICLGDWNVVAGNIFDFVYVIVAFVIFCVVLRYSVLVPTVSERE